MSRKDLSTSLSVVLLDEECPLESYYNKISLLGRLFGIDFDSNSTIRKTISYIIICTVLSTAIWYLIRIGLLVFMTHVSPHTIGTSITIFMFVLQSTLSMIFVVEWQRKGKIRQFILHLQCTRNTDGIHTNVSSLTIQLLLALSMTTLVFVYMTTTLTVYLSGKNVTVVDRQIVNSFGSRETYIIPILTTQYTLFMWNLSLLIYIFCVQSTFYEIRKFNQSIKMIDADTEIRMCKEISGIIKKYNDIAGKIRSLDKIFKRFAFVMIALSIPSTLFTSYVVFSRIHSDIEEKIIMLPALLYILYSFFSLTIIPAKLHDEICKTKEVFYENTKIWYPFRSSVYQAAIAFSSHLEQSNLGISIWGFATLSRPLILTTLSVMMTSLALLLQFKGYKIDESRRNYCNCSLSDDI